MRRSTQRAHKTEAYKGGMRGASRWRLGEVARGGGGCNYNTPPVAIIAVCIIAARHNKHLGRVVQWAKCDTATGARKATASDTCSSRPSY